MAVFIIAFIIVAAIVPHAFTGTNPAAKIIFICNPSNPVYINIVTEKILLLYERIKNA